MAGGRVAVHVVLVRFIHIRSRGRRFGSVASGSGSFGAMGARAFAGRVHYVGFVAIEGSS